LRNIHPNILAATFAVMLVVSWAATSAGQTESVDKLTKASECTYQGGHFINGQKLTVQMTVKNDGGWCWSDGYSSPSTGRYLSARDLVVTDPPKHGHAVVGDMPNHYLRIAYQPAPGFSGQDSFTVHYNVTEAEKTIQITVSK
jgi:hypothetical protein